MLKERKKKKERENPSNSVHPYGPPENDGIENLYCYQAFSVFAKTIKKIAFSKYNFKFLIKPQFQLFIDQLY